MLRVRAPLVQFSRNQSPDEAQKTIALESRPVRPAGAKLQAGLCAASGLEMVGTDAAELPGASTPCPGLGK